MKLSVQKMVFREINRRESFFLSLSFSLFFLSFFLSPSHTHKVHAHTKTRVWEPIPFWDVEREYEQQQQQQRLSSSQRSQRPCRNLIQRLLGHFSSHKNRSILPKCWTEQTKLFSMWNKEKFKEKWSVENIFSSLFASRTAI